MNLPFLVFSDNQGKIYSHPFLRMASATAETFIAPKKDDLIVLPEGSSLFYMPKRLAVGFNPKTGLFETLKEFRGKPVYAVSAFLIPAYLRLYNPAYVVKDKKSLPLWAYASCGFYGGKFFVTAMRIDRRIRQSPKFYDNKTIKEGVRKALKKYPKNRLYKHLANCALNYNCLAAKNLFLQRWEGPLPTSRFCNASCIGCLSLQESDCNASHERINFRPEVSEIVEVAYNHLAKAKEAIVSFGQGCEGEPLLEADLIAEAAAKMREKTNRGTIHVNTNASLSSKIKLLCEVGVDSFRVSANSVIAKMYDCYFKPRNYTFSDVRKSIEIAKSNNKFVSLNLLVFPGVTDTCQELKALRKFIKDTGIDMIQWRNLNIDPTYYLEHIRLKESKPVGILAMVEIIKKEFPHIKMGYFNIPKEQFPALRKNNPLP